MFLGVYCSLIPIGLKNIRIYKNFPYHFSINLLTISGENEHPLLVR